MLGLAGALKYIKIPSITGIKKRAQAIIVVIMTRKREKGLCFSFFNNHVPADFL